MKDYKKILEGVVNIINTTEKSDIGFANICTYIGENCHELKESEDEMIKTAILNHLKKMWGNCQDDVCGVHIEDAIAWFEKQGKKPQCKSALEAIREEKVDDANKIEPKDYSSIDPHFGKPAYKVNPKFHEGEWTVSKLDRKARQISEVHFDEYNSYYVVNGKDVNLEEYDRLHHLWTINDAKDGDVLVTVDDENRPFIYKGCLDPNHPDSPVAYCGIDADGYFCSGGCKFNHWWTSDKVQPSTKEQRDTLMKAMTDAGYTFDFDKKELKFLISNGGDFESNNSKQKYVELSEEDEKMRKAILTGLIDCRDAPDLGWSNFGGIEIDDCIAWLEKQGEKDKLIRELGEYKVKYIQETLGKALTMNNKDDERVRKTTIAFLKDFADKGYENAVECIAWLESKKYALKSFKDEDVRKFMQYIEKQAKAYEFNLPNRSYDVFAFAKDILIWLEKQGDKPQGKSALESRTDKELVEEVYSHLDSIKETADRMTSGNFMHNKAQKDSRYDNQNCVKHTDKVEPKFKVGDWITNYYGEVTWKVISVDYVSYTLQNQLGKCIEDTIDYVNEAFHLWTIQDAKEGDVLAFDNDTIVIFKDLYNSTSFHSYCHIEDGIFDFNKDDLPDWWNGEGFKPATKEQSDILFQKMKEAGYEWDAEKKELMKVEPKFKVGDWIVTPKNKVFKITSIEGTCYSFNNESTYWEICYCDEECHLWTIQDAKDGDVLAEDSCIFIIKKIVDNCTAAKTHCTLYDDGDFNDGSILYFDIDSTKLATKEQSDLLFQRMKEAGYKWDAETKTLKKLVEPKFKVGDRIKHIVGREEIATVVGVGKLHYNLDSKVGTSSFSISLQREWELVTNKFDINTLIPFESRVLVRDHNCYEWEGEIFTRYAKSFNNCNFVTLGGESWKQCIPYNDDTKHLLGTTDDCEEYYKNWCNV